MTNEEIKRMCVAETVSWAEHLGYGDCKVAVSYSYPFQRGDIRPINISASLVRVVDGLDVVACEGENEVIAMMNLRKAVKQMLVAE